MLERVDAAATLSLVTLRPIIMPKVNAVPALIVDHRQRRHHNLDAVDSGSCNTGAWRTNDDVRINTNTLAINMEEVAPVAVVRRTRRIWWREG